MLWFKNFLEVFNFHLYCLNYILQNTMGKPYAKDSFLCKFTQLKGIIEIQFYNKNIPLHINSKSTSLHKCTVHSNVFFKSFIFLFKTLLRSLSQEFQQTLSPHLSLFQASNLLKNQQQPQELSCLLNAMRASHLTILTQASSFQNLISFI